MIGTRPRTSCVFTVALMLAAATPGCSDASAPRADLFCPGAGVALCAKSDSVRSVVLPAVNDARLRNVGALKNATQAARLGGELRLLEDALRAGNVTAADAALRAASDAIGAARPQLATYPGDAPDLAAVELALIQIARAIK